MALRDRVPVLHVYLMISIDDFNLLFAFNRHIPQRHEIHPECRVSFLCVAISSFRVRFDSRL